MATAVAVEIEVAAPRSASLFFQPLQRKVRGRFNARDIREPEAAKVALKWPEPIPGQRLGLGADGAGYLLEPLHLPEHKALADKVRAAGMQLPPEREEFPDADAPTWLFWIKRAVEAGLARVVSGKLPERIDGRPRKQFILPEQADPRDGLIKRLVGIIYAGLPEAKRREVEAVLAEADVAGL